MCLLIDKWKTCLMASNQYSPVLCCEQDFVLFVSHLQHHLLCLTTVRPKYNSHDSSCLMFVSHMYTHAFACSWNETHVFQQQPQPDRPDNVAIRWRAHKHTSFQNKTMMNESRQTNTRLKAVEWYCLLTIAYRRVLTLYSEFWWRDFFWWSYIFYNF